MSARALLLIDLIFKVTYLDKTIGFNYSELNLDNLKTAFNITSVSYLEDSRAKRFYPLFKGNFEENISERLFLRQEIPKKSPSVKIYPTESRFVWNAGAWNSGFTELHIGYSIVNKHMRFTAINFQDLSKIDKKQKIWKVYLRLVGTYHETPDPIEVYVHRADDPWYSLTTFDQLPAFRKEPYSTTIVEVAPQIPYFWDVTGIVKDWLSETFPNNGIVLKANDSWTISTTRFFHNAHPEKKPCLLVYYE